MMRRSAVIFLLLAGFVLTGCPKRPPAPAPPIERPPFANPIDQILGILSFADTLQAKTSIRIDLVRNGEKQFFALNGSIFYQKPDKLRLLGYHPLGMGLFDALYRDGDFSILIPLQKTAFTGAMSQYEDVLKKAGEIQVTFSKNDLRDIPDRIRINLVEKEIEIDLHLKQMQVNQPLPDDAFLWILPEGAVERPLSDLLRGIK